MRSGGRTGSGRKNKTLSERSDFIEWRELDTMPAVEDGLRSSLPPGERCERDLSSDAAWLTEKFMRRLSPISMGVAPMGPAGLVFGILER